MEALTQPSGQQVILLNIHQLFPPLVPIPSSGAMKRTAAQAQAVMQSGLMKFSCPLKQKLFPLLLRAIHFLAPQITVATSLAGEMAETEDWVTDQRVFNILLFQ